jgi:cytoskeletal protein CcmA (bactofilin family)
MSTPVPLSSVAEKTTIGAAVSIRGEVRSEADLTIDALITGPIWCEGHEIVLGAGGAINGDVIARDVTIYGRVTGQIIATDVVDIRAGAVVTGKIITRRFILEAGGAFQGRVEPEHLDTAVRVARYQRGKQEQP